jgi:hypothetical protein
MMSDSSKKAPNHDANFGDIEIKLAEIHTIKLKLFVEIERYK